MSLIKNTRLGKFITVLSLSLFSSYMNAETVEETTPYSFYQGSEINVLDTSTPFYWLELPVNAYINSAYPKTLQDVRVFNGTGNEMPSVLFSDTEKSVSNEKVVFTPQRLVTQVDSVNSDDDVRRERQHLLVESIPGKVNRIELPSMQAKDNVAYQAYLLTRNQNQTKDAPVKSLTLNWAKSEKEWQAKVSIFASDDKENWLNVASNQPIMNLKLNSETIASNNIELLNGNSKALNAPYLMAVIVSAPDIVIPDLLKVDANSSIFNSTDRQELFHFEMTNDGVSKDHIIYQLPRALPLSELQIQLQQPNRVIPLKIEYSSDRGESWKLLTNIVAYNQTINGDLVSNPSTALYGEMVGKVKISALKGSWEDQPPRLTGKRDAYNLIFNLQGPAPYLLVWGNKQASFDKLTTSQLVGKPDNIDELMTNYPQLFLDNTIIELGGVDRLTSVEEADDNFNWLTMTLWILLFIGILALIYFCWYLLKEVNSSDKANHEEL
ncbi:DUF3999 family protein [Providencia huaxiensis]|uniref:DUF3999 family protein n=1 Tax=Providencia rettgeri TaxID=587 RepID=A0A427HMJ1_PRORE|nr:MULTISPECIES: DUF3999 family protein [Providencia]ELR5216183.1 DUF3999 family protein [Providencia rettgeri]MBV2191303.1 DUF3999 domain-containing protein [Providencia rettgeri]UPS64546.1 DUF3999 domain-containing protein [Providencia rettgeri]HEC8323102.1 DUF3999 family protein [Providencia rettgeri]